MREYTSGGGERGALYAAMLERWEAMPVPWRRAVCREIGVLALALATTEQLRMVETKLLTS